MGAAESTTRTNGTKEEEEERQGASGWSRAAAGAAMGLAAVGVVALGISKIVSENTEKDDEMKMKGTLMEARSYSLPNSSTYSQGEYGMYTPDLESNQRTSWCPPLLGCFKMNTDGACQQHKEPLGSDNHSVTRGPSGYAGVIRDHRGKWVQGFHGFIGVTDCLTAEFYGIYKGLELLDKWGYKGATLESDCEPAVNWINQVNNSRRRRSKIIDDCWEMIMESRRLKAKNNIAVTHCDREFNKLADKLADMAINKQDKYQEIMDIPTDEIQAIVNKESRVLSFIH